MTLQYTYHGPAVLSAASMAKIEQRFRSALSDPDTAFSMRSRSGLTAAIAMTILTEIGRPFVLQSMPGFGYAVTSEAAK